MKKEINEDQLIVITGAAGFIGSGVVRYLNDKGFSNLLLVDDIGKTAKWKNLLGKKFVDLIGIEDLFPFLERKESNIQAFIHLGACSDTMETDGDYILKCNYRYSVRLAEYALNAGIRFIYASSAATYGDGHLGFSDELGFMQQLKPLNLYGFSKHLFDLWALQKGVLNKLVGLKYFNVFGPNEDHKGRMASMIYKMTPVCQKEGKIQLFKSNSESFVDGGQMRDFIYVKDAVHMTCQFLENSLGGIYNIGSAQPTTWNTLADAVFKALGKKSQIEYIPMPEALSKAYQNYTCADMSKYREAYGLQELPLKYSIETAVQDYVQNYLLKESTW